MCGIFCAITCKGTHDNEPSNTILTRLKHRGPDSACHKLVNFSLARTSPVNKSDLRNVTLHLCSTVLALRGESVVSQPLQDEISGSLLCWNGEAWSVGEEPLSGNDTSAIFDLLLDASRQRIHGEQEGDDKVIQVLMSINGPFAFVFYDHPRSRIYFGRDSLGRRSLLSKSQEEYFAISSVSDGSSDWKEVEANGVYVLYMQPSQDSQRVLQSEASSTMQFHGLDTLLRLHTYVSFGKHSPLNRSLPKGASGQERYEDIINVLHERLLASLKIRARKILVPRQPVSNAASEDANELAAVPYSDYESAFITYQCSPKVAVLFSGGIDCVLIARLLHDILPPEEEIDLLNVAFENPRLKHGENSYGLCPDRITARASHSELETVCPGRKWRLVEINIPFAEAMEHRAVVVSLMHPHKTEMDLSIAFALYFASRGIGEVVSASGKDATPYRTPARVLFSGLGADEFFGGYQRHATAFNRSGYEGLFDELQLDISRLGQRNLGRDDRVLSHWGREARYPYLDEAFVSWVVSLPIDAKVGFGQNRIARGGEEDGKLALRRLALKLGMSGAAHEKKRAIQFGARTAKMEGGGRTKGTQVIS